MLETGSVARLHVTEAMQQWWSDELVSHRRKLSNSTSKTTIGDQESSTGKEDVTRRGDSEQSGHQWGETLPGRGGT
jgi:hypothetical protein